MLSNMLLVVILVINIILAFSLYSLLKSKRKEEEKMVEDTRMDNMLLKQQETLSTIENINQNYRVMLEQLGHLYESNASSSQIISDMSSRISSMNDVMVNKKSRGNWGEYQLNTLLSIYAGESQEIFEIQYPLKNGYIGDVALHLPGNDKVMMIDSKFPLENYQNIIQEGIVDTDRVKYESLFKQNIKKHVNDINKKYITVETTDLAVMFVPSEAIYMYICSECPELIEYAHTKHILLTSPTTLLGVVFTLVNATKDFNRTKHIKDIEKHIVMMNDDAKRLVERVEKSQGFVNQLSKSMNDVKISSDKIATRIGKVSDGYIEEKE